MEVPLNPDVQSKLARLAAERGRDAEALAREAIERFVDYDEWFVNEVEKGLAQIARGEVLTHEEVGARLEKSLTEKQSRPQKWSFAGQRKLPPTWNTSRIIYFRTCRS